MYKTFKYRINPNKEQRDLIDKTFNSTRFVWNYFLNMRNQEFLYESVNVNYYECCRQLTELKKDPSFSWLKDVDIYALQSELKYLEDSFVGYFKHNSEHPKFKSKKDSRNSYTTKYINGNIRISEDSKYIKVPKIGNIRIRLSRKVEGSIIQVVVSKSRINKYYVSVICKIEDVEKVPIKERVGIDLGIRTYATLSNGWNIEDPYSVSYNVASFEKRQSVFDRKPRESKRKAKQKLLVAKTYEKIVNKRKDFQHKASTEIIRKFDMIVMEDLDIKSLREQPNKDLRTKIEKCAWYNFIRIIKYKSELYGKTFVQIDRFFPSSKTCHVCGSINKNLKLSEHKWTCPSCKTVLWRDRNAAINILAAANV